MIRRLLRKRWAVQAVDTDGTVDDERLFWTRRGAHRYYVSAELMRSLIRAHSFRWTMKEVK